MTHDSQIRTRVNARAGLLGNPSDGFGGKTISFSIEQFAAEVWIEPSPNLEILPQPSDIEQYGSVAELARHVETNGYYGAIRLVKATIKRFHDFCLASRLLSKSQLDQGFRIGYGSDIPRAVGLAGSSAIIIATLRALERFFSIQVPQTLLPSVALSVEVNELKIPAGLQDRVIQCYQGMVSMDFAPAKSHSQWGYIYGEYRPLTPAKPIVDQLYIAYGSEAGQPTEVLHNDLRGRFDAGDPQIRQAMLQFAEFAELGRLAIVNGDVDELNSLINQNFALRHEVCDLHQAHIEMIRAAQACGASAKYCGSGGAIVGLCPESKYSDLTIALAGLGCEVIRPTLVPAYPAHDASPT